MQHDTAPQVANRYYELNAALTPGQRLQIAVSLSQSVRELALAGVRQRHPHASLESVRWHFAEVLYGTQIATRAFGLRPPVTP